MRPRNGFTVAPCALALAILLQLGCSESAADSGTDQVVDHAVDGWTPQAPREEIRPLFGYDLSGGRSGSLTLTIAADDREGQDGFWSKIFPVEGGQHYRFEAVRKLEGAEHPRRSALVRIHWRDDQGRRVPNDRARVPDSYRGGTPLTRPSFPVDGSTDADGWTEVNGVYRSPSQATQAIVELHLQWAPNAKIAWSDVVFEETSAPPSRKVRLATVHFKPSGGKTPADNRKMFVPFIDEAAAKEADLVVLGEFITYQGLGLSPAEVAEPLPGPSTQFFGHLARRHDLYVVAGLFERDGHLVYNTAVLIGPDGELVGKYRKVTLPREEVMAGVTPGHEYPVFDTRFGKVGMMICYDGFFPEVARELATGGAEIIAWPVAGCNPRLARARAAENHVYIVSSTYTDHDTNWMISAVLDHAGESIVEAKQWGTVEVAEVDLAERIEWMGPGDFKSLLPRHRPVAEGTR